MIDSSIKKHVCYGLEKGLVEDTVTHRDLFDTKLMSALVPSHSIVTEKFNSLYNISPEDATDYFYNLSCDSDYIRRYRIKKDIKWPMSVIRTHSINPDRLIEVMGLNVLPSRLKNEISLLKTAILNGDDIRNDEILEKHADWTDEIKNKYSEINADNIDEIINDEIGIFFKGS